MEQLCLCVAMWQVTGLERLGELSAPHHVAASTGTTPLGKAAAPAGPLEDE